MIQIIRYGKPKRKPRRFLAKCRHCGCEFVFDEAEITRPRWPGFRPYAKCPSCHEEIFLGSSQIVRELAEGEME